MLETKKIRVKPELSKRAIEMPSSAIRKLVPFADEAKKRGIKVYHLNIGQPDIPTPKKMMNILKEKEIEVLGYGPSNGFIEYREKLCEYYKKYNINVSPDQIIITTGGSEAVLFAFWAILNEGDEILIFEPFYTNYLGFAVSASAKVVPVPTHISSGYHLPDKEIVSLITDRTKAIITANPNNPTGTILTKEEMDLLCEISLEFNLFIIIDEVYREFAYDNREVKSILTYPQISDRAIMIDSISKRYSACGARIGCLVSYNKDLIASVLKFAYARLCPPSFEQYLGIAGIDLPDSYFVETIDEYKKRRDITYEALSDIKGVECSKPEGAFYIMAKLPVDDVDKFAIWLLEEFNDNNETVMVAPGSGFYATEGSGTQEVRIAYVLGEKPLKRALEILKIALDLYPGKIK